MADAATWQWLIERGQPEGEEWVIWLENSGEHPASHKHWTRNAYHAAMFPTREMAEAYIAEEGLEARAVEHGFMAVETEEDRLRARVTELEAALRYYVGFGGEAGKRAKQVLGE